MLLVPVSTHVAMELPCTHMHKVALISFAHLSVQYVGTTTKVQSHTVLSLLFSTYGNMTFDSLQ